MFSKLKKSANPASRFYEVPANTEVVRCGYMYKSPSQNLLSRSLKSWKRRFFVLSKMPINHYELKFFKDESRREKPLGQIQLYQVSLFFRHADSHPIWPWIQRNFRCSASCVLYMRVQEREYFLIGENSCEMDSWFDAIFKALNTPCASQPDSEDIRNRSMSEPLNVLHHDQKEPGDQEQNETDPKPSSFSRQSAPTFINMQRSHYDYPKNYMMTSQSLESEDTDDDEEDETINKDSEAEEDNSYYMDMESVREVIKQTQQEDVLFPQTNLEGNNVSENSFLYTGNEDSSSTALNWQISPGSETFVPVEKEICVSQDELKNSVIFSEETGKLCVSRWRYTQSSAPFHVGDQILAINDLLTDSLVELQSYLKRLSKDQVKLTILRQPGSQPLSACYT
ncbi:pleckstrin homology domain-containing family S member 1-like isoform X4 [Neoarius graeffei]|uniref:pleckstrin homology domain-containing family S member 1-like isoform X4 n=1 Tax=Neoarius graeffei TaxID=443677 RepID=UPI00298D1B2D|nr:pleckstrin homology domain-containing family S member 1-like isoform X4 [Neoarius graeffei]